MQFSPIRYRVSRVLSAPAAIAAVGLGALGFYVCLSVFHGPLPAKLVDTELIRHSVSTIFTYASSPLDLSVMSPFEGLGGLVEPIGVWLHPAYILPHLLPASDPRIWSYLAMMCLCGLATFLLGRSTGLPCHLAVIGAQLLAVFSFPPMWQWALPYTHINGSLMFQLDPGTAFMLVLGTTLLAVFSYLGRLSTRMNVICVILIPLILVYGVLCDPLFITIFCIPVAFFAVGVFFGSDSRRVLAWRTGGAAFCLAVCLCCNLHGFFRALIGYAARTMFPNELYMEVQKWDPLTGLLFQGGLATAGVIVLMICCILVCLFGTAQMRGFALAVLLYQFLMIVINLVYIYSGIHWSQPLPVYFEVGGHAAYVVVTLLGLWVISKRLARFFRTFDDRQPSPGVRRGRNRIPDTLTVISRDRRGGIGRFPPRLRKNRLASRLGPEKNAAGSAPSVPVYRLPLLYGAILVIPLFGMACVLLAQKENQPAPVDVSVGSEEKRTGIVKDYLEPQLAIGEDGR